MTLLFDQSKAIEKALGEEAAKPVIEAFQTSDQRVMSALLAEVATKADVERLRGELNARLARLENMVKVLIGLAALAVAFFSPVAEKLLGHLK
ncbi:hypothetical protein [Solidesulfovibrio sp.]|uniref:hypothetical protein n=1 Tax=Solidesulfovibrio sp. TaxID=2910990 RepID=UPI00260C58DA|nr:hypothetical protein [Solidesulfovibrio sp.]